MLFLTSLSPNPKAYQSQSIAMKSLLSLKGSRVISFNHKTEAPQIKRMFRGVEVHETMMTAESMYGKPYIRIMAFLNWVKANKGIEVFTLINSDIIVEANEEKWRTIEEVVKGGSHIIAQRYDFNDYGNIRNATKQGWGIDMFVLHREHLKFLNDEIYAMGQPYWDYWLPFSLYSNGVRVLKIFETPLIYHKLHEQRWNTNTWHMLARHFSKSVRKKKQMKQGATAYEFAMSVLYDIVYNSEELDFKKKYPDTHSLFRNIMKGKKAPVIFDIGAHMSQDARTLSFIKGSKVYAFEPDKRNNPEKLPHNVVLETMAIGNENGTVDMHVSNSNGGVHWTQSSSIKKPTGHHQKFPGVKFSKDTMVVPIMKLDTYCKEKGIKKIDLIHADVQGAELDMILGAKEILKNTHYLYTEYSDQQLYEGQPTLKQILDVLDGWEVVEDLKTDALLVNTNFNA